MEKLLLGRRHTHWGGRIGWKKLNSKCTRKGGGERDKRQPGPPFHLIDLCGLLRIQAEGEGSWQQRLSKENQGRKKKKIQSREPLFSS